MIIKKLKNIVKWSTPYGLLQYSRKCRRDFKYSSFAINHYYPEILPVLKKNIFFKDHHKGQRCFILGTGPSINKLDITKLKNENCIFLSQFYFHKKYEEINPKYHLFSGVYLHQNINLEKSLAFYEQIEKRVSQDTTIFLNYLDYKFIQQYNILKNHEIFYLFFKRDIKDIFRKKLDATKFMFGISNISAMAIQMAIYMGFKDIYMLGVDHDSTRLAHHFYDEQESIVDSLSLQEDKLVVRENTSRMFLNMLDEYRILYKLAETRNTKIYNATIGGMLNLFPRINFDSLF